MPNEYQRLRAQFDQMEARQQIEKYRKEGAAAERERLAKLAEDNALQTGEQLADWIRAQEGT